MNGDRWDNRESHVASAATAGEFFDMYNRDSIVSYADGGRDSYLPGRGSYANGLNGNRFTGNGLSGLSSHSNGNGNSKKDDDPRHHDSLAFLDQPKQLEEVLRSISRKSASTHNSPLAQSTSFTSPEEPPLPSAAENIEPLGAPAPAIMVTPERSNKRHGTISPVMDAGPSRLPQPLDIGPSTAHSSITPSNKGSYASGLSTQQPGEDDDAFYVRSTYARLEVQGVFGDGWDEGIERTRERAMANRRKSQYPGTKGDDLTSAEKAVLEQVDRYGFFDQALKTRSESRLALLPTSSLKNVPKLPKRPPQRTSVVPQQVSAFDQTQGQGQGDELAALAPSET